MEITYNSSVRLPLRLIDALNTSITGVVAADLTNGVTASRISLVRGDGTVYDLALTDGVNFFEIDATAAPGLYHVVVPAAATDVVGSFVMVALPTAALFLSSYVTCQVVA